jgi:hypothetical protein
LTTHQFREDEGNLIEIIENTIRRCDDVLRGLQEELVEWHKLRKLNSQHGFRNSIKAAARQLKYPFRRRIIQRLSEDFKKLYLQVSQVIISLQYKETETLLELVRPEQISTNIRDWLRAPDASINHKAACAKRCPNTDNWLILSETYTAWLTGRNSSLWLSGSPGSGKSVLFSTAIQNVLRHRRSDPRIGIGFFYFTFNDGSKRGESAMLRTFLLQLSSKLQDGYQDLAGLYKSYPTVIPPARVLLECLRRLMRRFDHTYLMLDALDEIPRNVLRENVLNALGEMRHWGLEGVHLFVTSRNELDIRQLLNPLPSEEIVIGRNEIDKDIANYISFQLTEDQRLESWLPYREKIQEKLVKGAHGMYVYNDC